MPPSSAPPFLVNTVDDGTQPGSVVVADFNDDTLLDLAVGGDEVVVLLGGQRGFHQP